jgi:hypothetical protein
MTSNASDRVPPRQRREDLQGWTVPPLRLLLRRDDRNDVVAARASRTSAEGLQLGKSTLQVRSIDREAKALRQHLIDCSR